MARYKSIVSNFSGGLVSPNLVGRTDIERTKSSLTKMENFIPDLQGPASYRQGWGWKNRAFTPPQNSVSINILLATNKSYQVIFVDQGIYVVRSDGQVMTVDSNGDPYPIPSPYGQGALKDLRFSSETDVLYITHGSYRPRKFFPGLQYTFAQLQSTEVDGTNNDLQSTEEDNSNLNLIAEVEVDGDDDWTLEAIDFEREPFLDVDETGDQITASSIQRITKIESSYSAEFDIIANAATPTDYYVEYEVGNVFLLGKVITSGGVNYPEVTEPTLGGGFVYVEPVDSIVDIQDPDARLFLLDNDTETTAGSKEDHALIGLGVHDGEVRLRSDVRVFSNNQVGSWVRVGSDRISDQVPIQRDRSRTRWVKIKKHEGVRRHPIDYIFGGSTLVEEEYQGGDIYRALYFVNGWEVLGLDGNGQYNHVAAKIEDGVTNVFSMAGKFNRVATTDDDDNIVADLSTVIEADEVVCYNASVPGDNVPVVEEYAANNTSGALITTTGELTVTVVANEITLNSTGSTFSSDNVGRHILGTLADNYVFLKVRRYVTSSQVVAELLSPFPKNRVTQTLENNGRFESFRLGAWFSGNYPRTVAKYEQRRVYGGTYTQPNYIFFSKTGEELDFSPAETNKQVLDTNGISYPLSNINSSIRWVKSGTQLLIGTTGGVFRLLPNQFAASVSPTSIRIEMSDDEGCDQDGILVGSSVFFPDQSNSRLLEYNYESTNGTFTNDVSKLLFPTFVSDSIVKVQYQHTPQPRLWVLTESHNLYVLTYYKAENFYAWSKVITQGDVRDICVMREGSDNDVDQVWITRSYNGFSHEVLDESLNVYLDKYSSAIVGSYSQPPSLFLEVDNQYQVDDVLAVYFGGVYLGDSTVFLGGPLNTKRITVTSEMFSKYATSTDAQVRLYYGYKYTALMTPMNPSYDIANGNVFGAEESRIVTNKMLVASGVTYEIGVGSTFEKRTLKTLSKNNLEPFSGFDKERPTVNAKFGEDAIPTIKHSEPNPLTISALITKSDIHV
jgi:hypothetical protein